MAFISLGREVMSEMPILELLLHVRTVGQFSMGFRLGELLDQSRWRTAAGTSLGAHHQLALMARGFMLEENCRPVDPHEEEEVVHRDLFVPRPIHGAVFGQEVKAFSPSLSTEAIPDHNTGRVFDSFLDYFVLVSAHGFIALHCGGPGMDQAESRLFAELHFASEKHPSSCIF